MKKKLLLITTLLISFNTISQVKNCQKAKKIEDLNSISKCQFKQGHKNPNGINKTFSRSYKKNNNKNIAINLTALQRSLSQRDFKTAKTFNSIDRIPTFKKCVNLKNKKRLNCFNNNMTRHIEKEFHYPNKALIKKIKGKVTVIFIINKTGKVSNIEAIGPKNGDLLINEAKRIISNLPVFLPGKNNGIKIPVKLETTINFKIN